MGGRKGARFLGGFRVICLQVEGAVCSVIKPTHLATLLIAHFLYFGGWLDPNTHSSVEAFAAFGQHREVMCRGIGT